jgi:hypothetical protein
LTIRPGPPSAKFYSERDILVILGEILGEIRRCAGQDLDFLRENALALLQRPDLRGINFGETRAHAVLDVSLFQPVVQRGL